MDRRRASGRGSIAILTCTLCAAVLGPLAPSALGFAPGTLLASSFPSALASPPAARIAAARAPGATNVGAAPSSQQIQLVLPLKADDAGLERFASSVATRGSPQYGHYESLTALARRFGASPSTRARVLGYLHSVGARAVKLDATGLFADATIATGLAQRLFGAPLARFRTANDERFVAPTGAVSIPAPLRGLISGVVGLDTRPVLGAPAPPAALHTAQAHAAHAAQARAHAAQAAPASLYEPRSGVPRGCAAGVGSGGFTPNQYLTAYGYGALHHARINGGGERVALIEIDGFRHSDITTFARCFGLPVPAIRPLGVGLSRALPPGGEATLDVELLDAAAPGLKEIDVYESRPGAAQALLALTAPLQASVPKPQVISASLGLCEQTLVGAVGTGGITATQSALAMAAASGITFLAASGDSGSADCTDRSGVPQDFRAVNYPASSRWATGVGGTNFVLDGTNHITQQIAWNDTDVVPGSAGGGGFSTIFGRPSYQRGTVAGSRRAVPDVSMLSDVAPGYAIYCSADPGCVDAQNPNPWSSVGGTSAATPLLAGGFALVDQALRLHGRRALGLANPLLYAIGRSTFASQVFSDVTQYNNDVGPYIPGNGQSLGCCDAGPGFDEASGLGSVDLARFAVRALSAQPSTIRVGLSLQPSQRPVARHRILAIVSCSRSCSVAAAAKVRIGSQKPFVVISRTYRQRSRGSRTIALRFSANELRRLRAALARHERIVAGVIGVIVDRGGGVQTQTGAKRLRIRS